MTTCAFIPCADAETCCLGGCIQQRFETPREASELRKGAPALNGTVPGRATKKDSAR